MSVACYISSVDVVVSRLLGCGWHATSVSYDCKRLAAMGLYNPASNAIVPMCSWPSAVDTTREPRLFHRASRLLRVVGTNPAGDELTAKQQCAGTRDEPASPFVIMITGKSLRISMSIQSCRVSTDYLYQS